MFEPIRWNQIYMSFPFEQFLHLNFNIITYEHDSSPVLPTQVFALQSVQN